MRRVEVDYSGFDGKTHRGALIVNDDLAAEVIAIVEQLLRLRYPIEKIRTVDNYLGADDELSMEDNNTSSAADSDISTISGRRVAPRPTSSRMLRRSANP